MKRLITITEETFGREEISRNDKKREAARAIVTTASDEIYLLHVTSHGYHKLPGGGINSGENVKVALAREIQEEVGCDAEIGQEIGEVLEYRRYEKEGLEQYSYCFLARQVGECSEQSLEQDEIDEGHDLVAAADIDEAIKIIENDKPNNTEGDYIQLRDLTILKAAKKLFSESQGNLRLS